MNRLWVEYIKANGAVVPVLQDKTGHLKRVALAFLGDDAMTLEELFFLHAYFVNYAKAYSFVRIDLGRFERAQLTKENLRRFYEYLLRFGIDPL